MSGESPDISVERVERFAGRDLADLCDASENAILEGGGFGWLIPPPRRIMERYWRGVLLVPERELFVGRLGGTIAGSAQLVRPPRNNEAQSFAARPRPISSRPGRAGTGSPGCSRSRSRTRRGNRGSPPSTWMSGRPRTRPSRPTNRSAMSAGNQPDFCHRRRQADRRHYYTKASPPFPNRTGTRRDPLPRHRHQGRLCVRLLRGEMSAATVSNNDPADQAKEFSGTGSNGCTWSTSTARVEGRPVNADAVAAILGATDLPVQLGGGIRDRRRSITGWRPASRARCSARRARRSDFVREACDSYPGRVALGIDARGGRVATEGWYKTTALKPLDLALGSRGAGLAAIIYTDIGRDGALGRAQRRGHRRPRLRADPRR